MPLRLSRGRTCVVAAMLAALACMPSLCSGATFDVSSVSAFQTALTTAQDNGAHDTINVAATTYWLSSPLTYESAQPFSLTIVGAGIGSAILDGGSTTQILNLLATGAGASLSIQGLTFQNGSTSHNSGGGALHMTSNGGSITISSCEVNDSSVTGTVAIGGGAAVVTETGDIDISNCFFRRNSAAANVGGLVTSTNSGTTTLTGCTFEDNSVNNIYPELDYYGDGGGAFLYAENGGTAIVTSSTFTGNTTTGGDNPDGGGLMIYLLGTDATASVSRCTFTNNQAGLGGGGLFMRINATGSVSCTNNTFTNNTALLGEGAGAFLYVDTGTITATGNTTDGNTAGAAGGGMWISLVEGNATISGNTFSGDHSGDNGGGLTVFTEMATATSTLTGNTFVSNTATGVGGGLSYASTAGSLVLNRSTFSGNAADGEGGDFYIYLDSSTAPTDVTDLIVWGGQPAEIGFSTGSGTGSLSIRYSDIRGGTGEPWFGAGCIDVDPSFEDAPGGDFRLSWDSFPVIDGTESPCIDTGDPTSAADPDGTRADMGAHPFDQAGTIFSDSFESGDTLEWSASVG